MHGSDAAQTSAKTDKTNPLKPADQVASDDDSNSSDGTAANGKSADAKSADKPGTNGFKTAAIDPELRKLMEAELAYEPPSERQQLLSQWSKFDPAFIRELVENHRMARETAENREHPVKLASADVPQEPAGQAPELDAQPATQPGPRSSAGAGSAVGPANSDLTNPKPTPPASADAFSPWSDSSDMPALSTAPQPASNAAAAPPGGTTGVGDSGISSPPSSPQRTGTTPSAPNAPDAFDSLDGPGQPAKPIAIVPMPAPQGATRNSPSKTDSANNTATQPASQVAPAPAAAALSPKADAFAGMTSLDEGTTAPAASAPPAVRTSALPAAAVTQASPPVGNSPAGASDGMLIQPGVAAPASVISSLQPQEKQAHGGSAGADFDAVSTSPSIDAPAAIRPPGQPSSSTSALDSVQPVQLQPPTDVPSNSAVTTAGADTKSPPPTDTPSTPANGAPSTPPSGLAGLGNRLMGALSPSLTAAAKTAIQSGSWHDELQKIVAFAASEAGQTSVGTTDAEKLKYVEKQVHLRMLYLLSGQPAKSLEPISGLDAPDQEFWQQVFWGLSNYFDKTAMADPSDRATQTIAQLRTAVQRLKEKSKLELRNVAFCQKISSYGNYERVKRDEFTPGQSVLLYAEVENFKSEPTTEGPYRTILKSTVEIFDPRGQLVVKTPFQDHDDLCANPRRDYYNTYDFAIPQRIGLGPHTLKLTVEDQISRKVATYTVNFTVK
jgi:hypothetical protein